MKLPRPTIELIEEIYWDDYEWQGVVVARFGEDDVQIVATIRPRAHPGARVRFMFSDEAPMGAAAPIHRTLAAMAPTWLEDAARQFAATRGAPGTTPIDEGNEES